MTNASPVPRTGSGKAGRVLAYSSFEPYELDDYLGLLAHALPDVAIEIERMATATLTARLIAEQSQPRADMIFGWADTASQTPDLAGIAVSGTDGYLRPSGFSTAFIVDPARLDALGAPAVRRWHDLTHPSLKGAVAFPDPALSGAGFLALTTLVQTYGEGGWDIVEGLLRNVGLHPGSAWAPAAATGQGVIAVGVTVRIAAHHRRGEDPALHLQEPIDIVGAEAEVYGVLRTCRSRTCADQIIDWLTTDATRPLFAAHQKIDFRDRQDAVSMIDAPLAAIERPTLLARYASLKAKVQS